MNLDEQGEVWPLQRPEVMGGDGEFGIAGLEEPRLLKLAMRLERLRREEVDIDEAASVTGIEEREVGALHEHEFAFAGLAHAFEKRSRRQHRDRGHARFRQQQIGHGEADLLAPEGFEWP